MGNGGGTDLRKKVDFLSGRLWKYMGNWFSLFMLCLLLSLTSDSFLTYGNITNVARQASVTAIIACGMTIVVLSGGIDLSVGSIVAFSSVIMAGTMQQYGLILGLLAGVMIGALMGFFNGIVISKGKVAPFVVTLGVMTIGRSFTLIYTGGIPISQFPPGFDIIGAGYLLGIPLPVWITLFVFLISKFILEYTKLGRYVYATGSNETAARLSGVHVDYYKTIIYVLSGIFSAIGGIVLTSRLYSAQPQGGAGYEMDAIAAVVIGGTSLTGGEGKISGTIAGALIMSVLRNGLNLLNVTAHWQQAIIGFVIIIAVLVDRSKKR